MKNRLAYIEALAPSVACQLVARSLVERSKQQALR
jgi:hypothetical protein